MSQEKTTPTKGLVDADMLVYEAAFCGQDRETGDVFSFDRCADMVDRRLLEIKDGAGVDELHLFLTGDGNFRFDIATVKPYKAKRPEKPWHYKNVRVYLEGLGAEVVQGMEADDALAMAQTDTTVICTRDKDLRQVPGWHYGWELGKQPEFTLQWVDEIGDIQLVGDKKKEIKGTGLKFFYSQMITGDTVDNIPGLPRGGAVLAYKTLANTTTEGEMFKAVRELYREKYEEDADERMLEQGQLLWMCRETDEDGRPILWQIPSDFLL